MRQEESDVIRIRSMEAHNSLVRGLVDSDCTSPLVIRSRGLPRGTHVPAVVCHEHSMLLMLDDSRVAYGD
jgi:hypothetical protein